MMTRTMIKKEFFTEGTYISETPNQEKTSND